MGKIAFDTYLAILRDDLQDRGLIRSRSPYRFCHGATYTFPAPLPTLIASYHPSRQNTNTGKLTPAMFLGIFEKAKSLLAKV